jgi:basic amino acid/polyamine antiporter, APA family
LKISQPTLNRSLGLFTATLLVAGIMIGSGIFKKIVPMSQTGLSEAWILIAWVIPGIITMFCALNLSGLASLTEESGGAYEYLRLSFGNFFSFLFGWSAFTVSGTATLAAVAFIFSQTLHSLVPLPNPLQPWEGISIGNFIYPFADSGIKILAILVMTLFTWVNYRGVKKGGYLNNIFTSTKILGIVILVVLGLLYISPDSVQQVTGGTAHEMHGIIFFSAFFTAMLSALWAYNGWLDVTAVTGEVKNPKRNVPLAVITGVSIVMMVYVLTNYSYMHVLPLTRLASVGSNEIGAAVVAETLIGNLGKTIIIVLIMISVLGTVNGGILVYSRIYFRMAQEGFFFQKFSRVHSRYRTPYFSLVAATLWSSLLIISGTFDMLTNMVVFTNFLFFGLLAIALIKMKRKGMIKVKTIGYPVVQVVIILFSVALIINTFITEPKQSLLGGCLVLLGVPFYYYFRKKRQSEKKEKQELTVETDNRA